jgi:hypothetical protein
MTTAFALLACFIAAATDTKENCIAINQSNRINVSSNSEFEIRTYLDRKNSGQHELLGSFQLTHLSNEAFGDRSLYPDYIRVSTNGFLVLLYSSRIICVNPSGEVLWNAQQDIESLDHVATFPPTLHESEFDFTYLFLVSVDGVEYVVAIPPFGGIGCWELATGAKTYISKDLLLEIKDQEKTSVKRDLVFTSRFNWDSSSAKLVKDLAIIAATLGGLRNIQEIDTELHSLGLCSFAKNEAVSIETEPIAKGVLDSSCEFETLMVRYFAKVALRRLNIQEHIQTVMVRFNSSEERCRSMGAGQSKQAKSLVIPEPSITINTMIERFGPPDFFINDRFFYETSDDGLKAFFLLPSSEVRASNDWPNRVFFLVRAPSAYHY